MCASRMRIYVGFSVSRFSRACACFAYMRTHVLTCIHNTQGAAKKKSSSFSVSRFVRMRVHASLGWTLLYPHAYILLRVLQRKRANQEVSSLWDSIIPFIRYVCTQNSKSVHLCVYICMYTYVCICMYAVPRLSR